MGIVTAGAFAVHNRRVDTFAIVLPDVALVTELTHVLDGLELVVAGLLMAVEALTDSCWSMHELGFPHLVMAACRDTRRALRRFDSCGPTPAKGNQNQTCCHENTRISPLTAYRLFH
jgi:hypothetical protein